MMLIDFKQAKLQQFDALARKIAHSPQDYLQFDSVADFYQAEWLLQFPPGTTWTATGLDDGATEFYALIEYQHHYLKISCLEQSTAIFGISNQHNSK